MKRTPRKESWLFLFRGSSVRHTKTSHQVSGFARIGGEHKLTCRAESRGIVNGGIASRIHVAEDMHINRNTGREAIIAYIHSIPLFGALMNTGAMAVG